jgi:hypothetical protein
MSWTGYPRLHTWLSNSKVEGGGNMPKDRPLSGVEREHILKALKETNGVIGGLDGAAARQADDFALQNAVARYLPPVKQNAQDCRDAGKSGSSRGACRKSRELSSDKS